MKIVVGSKNPAKLAAVRELLQEYPHLKDADVVGSEVASGVSEQPKSLEETVLGAVTRASNAFSECDFAIGIEAGFMQVPHTKSGHLNVTAVAIDDGTTIHLGLSSAFETPNIEIMRLVAEEGMTFDQAAHAAGLTEDQHIGKGEGIIGIITKGRLSRKAYVQEALRTALIHIDHEYGA